MVLAFLVDELRPELAREFRFDETDHGLLGDSVGGHFATYALLNGTEAFTKYLIGGPARAAAARRSLPRRGGSRGHRSVDGLGRHPRLHDTTAQTLRLRDYPGLRVTCRIFPRENHYTAVPSVINSGLRHL